MVSVVVPVHNAEGRVARCVESILAQTYADIELILVDDGSEDGSARICDKYAAVDKRVKVAHKTNGGVSSARNTGLEIATGTYVGFVDADDYIAPDMYERLVKAAQDANADQACSGFINVFQDREDKVSHAFKNTVLYSNQIYENVIIPLLTPGEADKKAKTLQNVWNKIYKKEIIDKNSVRFNESFNYAEDWLFNVEFYRFASVVAFIDYSSYYYDRTVEGSLSKRRRSNGFEDSIRLRRIEKECFPAFCTDEKYLEFVEKTWKRHIRSHAIQFGFEGFGKYINDTWASPNLIEAGDMGAKRGLLFWIVKRKRKELYYILAVCVSMIGFVKHYVKAVIKVK